VGHLIFNPVSGQGNPDQDLALIRSLLEPQVQVKVVFTEEHEDPADQAKAAIAAGAELIMASGGDGTISAVAGSLVETDIPLGVIPRGTANAFAVCTGHCDAIFVAPVKPFSRARPEW
jgi:diacylglycerol kinase (ATP)